MTKLRALTLAALAAAPFLAAAEPPAIVVRAGEVLHRVTPYLTGACIEDVNHEIYGGIDSQMIFGESFAEPAAPLPLRDFTTLGGRWTPQPDGSIQGVGSDGAKIIWNGPALAEGEVSVDVMLTESGGGNGGLILKVSDAAKGADAFNGYEVSLERPGFLVLGRHRQNWEPLRREPCKVPVNAWIHLVVRLTRTSLEALVDGQSVLRYEDSAHPLETGAAGLRIWQHEVRFRNLSIDRGAGRQPVAFAYDTAGAGGDQVSGMWRPVREDAAQGSFALVSRDAFSGSQSQQITFSSGSGVIGVDNAGLNRWGMNFVQGKPYDGYIYVRSAAPTEFSVALENRGSDAPLAEKKLRVSHDRWQRFDFTLKPSLATTNGRFVIELNQPGTLDIGYAFLEPGKWGRYKGLPVRKDVAEGLIKQGVTAMRLGGCMANAAQYRWKHMLGPRALRPPYEGWWHPDSSDGWGIFDFLNFCEAAGILAVPDVNCNETPADMADFVEYVNGTADSPWGRRRAAAGHPKPYHLSYLEIGNEERVDDAYWQKFRAIAEAVWARDPNIILVVGDFAYHRRIDDPTHISGADGHITSLEAQQKILALAKAHDREVWFDVHVGTEGPRPDFGGTFSYIDAIDRLANGAKHRVAIFEYNAGNHSQRRALANAAATIWVERDGRLPFVSSANCLQPDGQNDNDWDQGLLFLNPSQVWLQPPGYVTQMLSRHYEPLIVRSEIQNAGSDSNSLDVCAAKSEDGKTLVLQLVNAGENSVTLPLEVSGFTPARQTAQIETLAAPLNASNTAASPDAIHPTTSTWTHHLDRGAAAITLPANSFTVVSF